MAQPGRALVVQSTTVPPFRTRRHKPDRQAVDGVRLEPTGKVRLKADTTY